MVFIYFVDVLQEGLNQIESNNKLLKEKLNSG